MNHIMKPYPGSLPWSVRVVRTTNSCPCAHCRDYRGRVQDVHLPRYRTGVFDFIERVGGVRDEFGLVPRIEQRIAVLDAIAALGKETLA